MEFSSINFFTAIIIAAAVIHYSKPVLADDIGTNFFLKASKSVPRIGRRSMDYENYFLKASKSVPRIGRRRTLSPVTGSESEFPWYRPQKANPTLEKKAFPDKYFSESGQPIWSNIEKAYEEYPGMFQSDEPYREAVADADADLYWRRLKAAEESSKQAD